MEVGGRGEEKDQHMGGDLGEQGWETDVVDEERMGVWIHAWVGVNQVVGEEKRQEGVWLGSGGRGEQR